MRVAGAERGRWVMGVCFRWPDNYLFDGDSNPRLIGLGFRKRIYRPEVARSFPTSVKKLMRKSSPDAATNRIDVWKFRIDGYARSQNHGSAGVPPAAAKIAKERTKFHRFWVIERAAAETAALRRQCNENHLAESG